MTTTHQHQVATCNICREPIYAPCAGTSPDQFALLAQRAAQGHLAGHGPRERAQYVLSQLPALPPALRLPALKEAYPGLGDEDRRGVYGIEEALGSAAVYRLWLDANRCGGPQCRHAPDAGFKQTAR